MATLYRGIFQSLQQNESTAANRKVLVEVGTHEAQTVTVSKGGAAFAASDSVASQVDGSLYELDIAAADLDTVGVLAFKLVGATDTTYLHGLRVVVHDPYAELDVEQLAAAVLEELVADHQGVSGSLADWVNRIARQIGYGTVEVDEAAGTIETYDEDDTLLLTEERTEADGIVTWAPTVGGE